MRKGLLAALVLTAPFAGAQTQTTDPATQGGTTQGGTNLGRTGNQSTTTSTQATSQTPPPANPPAGPISLPATSATKPLLKSPTAKDLAAVVSGRSITIDDAILVALLTSRDFSRAQASYEAARARTSEQRTNLNVQVVVSGSAVEYDRSITANFAGVSIPIQKQFNLIINNGVTLPLDIFGSIRSAISQAQFSEIASRIDVNRTRNDLVFSVRNAFYNALRAQGNLVVAQDDLANTQARLKDAQNSLAAGTGTQFDVLTAQRDVANAEGGLVNARGAVTVALGQLKQAIGIDVSTPISVIDSGAVDDPGSSSPAPAPPRDETVHVARNEVDLGPDYDAAVTEAVQNRPEVLEGNAAIAAAEKGVTYARRSLYPQFSVGVGYNVQPYFAGFTPANLASIQLNFSIPIYEGGLAKARVREARAAVAQAEVDRRTTVDQVTLDVQQAYVNQVQARERVRVATLGVEQAREAFRLAQLRSRAGVSAIPQQSPQIELSNAQVSLTQAENNRVNALYDYNVARAALDRARGRYSYGREGGGFAQTPTVKETGKATPTTLTQP